MVNSPHAVIIGAGPGGLSAAYELVNHGSSCVVLEASAELGGLARTQEYKGCLFDMGGHRFFTRVALVRNMWEQVLGDDLLTRSRLSRIYYRSRFFRYPLEPLEAFFGLGIVESARCALSYLKSRLFPVHPEDDFQTWVSNRFGERLFEIFFRTYTEKVWGIPCREIRSEWASQRIRRLSLATLLRNAIRPGRNGTIKTLVHEFAYPRRGPGMLWNRVGDLVRGKGGRIVLEAPVDRICRRPGAVAEVYAAGRNYTADHFISTMPIRDLIAAMDPAPPERVCRAAAQFRYRDFITVVLIVDGANLFRDNWIYVHDSEVRVGRIQNYNNWSPDMVPNPAITCVGLEYFCSQGDELWTMSDAELRELAVREFAALGLAKGRRAIDGVVVRVPKAYPVYDESYRGALDEVRRFLEQVPNLQLVGRNGMHRYNNQDHSILTGIMAARNTLGRRYDLWAVNENWDYHEEGGDIPVEDLQALASSQPMVPERIGKPAAAGGSDR